ncbi:hypothetical protein HanXRQr2_Chr04g0152221 [Helianthus annuus]|uniref:Uncharacterized protein n=1 Tax=Helianthus annuus TaxID=4232 RepID=A0A9K3NQ66_HELAN|nr:hypothetical protein HanXRQr2_Chr04g0152221 [Helianthus annuus]KAJ0661691.1 hypothetical protein HanOQP8_Chr14g0551281 [Helianthus annuus]KAJ0882144.1 hypothetical protein HanPSC8_Chr10g0406291 [Helianthus annuus]
MLRNVRKLVTYHINFSPTCRTFCPCVRTIERYLSISKDHPSNKEIRKMNRSARKIISSSKDQKDFEGSTLKCTKDQLCPTSKGVRKICDMCSKDARKIGDMRSKDLRKIIFRSCLGFIFRLMQMFRRIQMLWNFMSSDSVLGLII